MTWNGLPIGQVQLVPNNRGYMAPTNIGPANTAFTNRQTPVYDETARLLARFPAPKAPATPAVASNPWDQSVMNRFPVPVSNPVAAADPVQQVVAATYGGLPDSTPNAFAAAPEVTSPVNFDVMSGFGMPSDTTGLPGFGTGQPASFMPQYDAASASNSWMPDWLKGAIGTKDNPGWGGFALGAANSLASMYFGMQQYGLAKQTLAENKRQFQLNYDAQKQTTNTALEDRQRARVASNPGAYQSVGEYMDKNGVK